MGPSRMNCAHLPIAIKIATPAKTVLTVSVELVSVASRTTSKPIANSPLVAARACAAHPLDDPCGWNLHDDDEEGVDEEDDADLATISPGLTGVRAFDSTWDVRLEDGTVKVESA